MYNPKVKILKFTLNRKIYKEFEEFVFRKETVGSWFEGSFTVDVSEPKPNRPNTMNLVKKWAQELGFSEDFIKGLAGTLGSRIIRDVEER